MNFNPEPFDLIWGPIGWAAVFGALLVAAALVGLLVSLLAHRGRGLDVFWSETKRLTKHASALSWRRIWSLTMLTFREAARRKALLVFGVFAILFMFAGWFLSNVNARAELQVKVYVSFVITAVTYLLLPVVMLLSCWGLPEDIKARSLHTVVTKPVRRHEIFIGRVLGFSMIGTLLLAAMGGISYVWITRQVPPEAQSELVCRVPEFGKLTFLDDEGIVESKKGVNVGDVWEFRSFIAGGTRARAIWTFDNVTAARLDNVLHLESRFEVFRTHKGNQKRGVQCEYHFVNDLRAQTARYLAATRGFEKAREQLKSGEFQNGAAELQKAADELQNRTIRPTPSEMDAIKSGFSQFAELLKHLKKEQGDAAWVDTLIAQALAGENVANAVELAEPVRSISKVFDKRAERLKVLLVDREARHPPFHVQEFREPQQLLIGAEEIGEIKYWINGDKENKKTGSLFDDLVHGGKLRVHLVCLDRGQYVGMAVPDLIIRMPDQDFATGFAKGLVVIWLQMVLVVILSVTASTFLKGPVATLLTAVLLLLGSLFSNFLDELVTGDMKSSGAFESMYRIQGHQNPQTEIGQDRGTRAIDKGLIGGLWGVHKIVPRFKNYRVAPYLANGFDVPWNAALLPALMTTFGFLIPCLFVGYLSLTMRELEEK